MKKLLLPLLLLVSSVVICQNTQKTTSAKSQTTGQQPQSNPKYGPPGTVQNLVTTQKHNICVNKKLSIVFHFIQDSSLNKTVAGLNNTFQLGTLITKMNSVFSNICVSFANCRVEIIPNYEYRKWERAKIDSIVLANYYTPKTLNIYVVEQITGGGVDGEAYAAPLPALNSTVTTKDFVVVTEGAMLDANLVSFVNSAIFHGLGHYFGLNHTFDEIGLPANPPPPAGVGSHEFVDRSNCLTNGDGICDTEADPYPRNFEDTIVPKKCNYFYNLKDSKNKLYHPPVDNFMSFYGCRCRYTQEQYNIMAEAILTRRIYLH